MLHQYLLPLNCISIRCSLSIELCHNATRYAGILFLIITTTVFILIVNVFFVHFSQLPITFEIVEKIIKISTFVMTIVSHFYIGNSCDF